MVRFAQDKIKKEKRNKNINENYGIAMWNRRTSKCW